VLEPLEVVTYVVSTFSYPISPGWTQTKLVEPMGFESASCMETKEFCGAAGLLERKERESLVPPP